MSREIDHEDLVEALDELFEVLDRADEEVESGDGQEFLADVRSDASDMHDRVLKSERATEAQLRAAQNWKAGVEKWLRD